MRASAFAKLNLGLEVMGSAPSGLHRIRGLFQSVDWPDALALRHADEDGLATSRGTAVIDGWDNIAWRAVTMARDAAGSSQRLHLELDKQIPVAAGLGGGSADAATALALAGEILGLQRSDINDLAPALGSDVAFCLRGGLATVSGTGEAVRPLEPAGGYAVALVTPPVELSTAAVYAAWDRLDRKDGPSVGAGDLPPSLREYGPLTNDLFPAAAAVAPEIDEWRADLQNRWSRPVLLTGSGPTLFAYFVDLDEAEDALDDVAIGARATKAAVPIDVGWRIESRERKAENRDTR